MKSFKNFINGEYVDASDGQTTAIIDPSTGQQYGEAALSGAADVDRAMNAAAQAFKSWGQTTPSERSLALYRIADAIEARADEIVAAEVQNTGKPIALTMSEEIPPMVDQIRFFAGAARMLEGKATAEYMANMTSMIRIVQSALRASRNNRNDPNKKTKIILPILNRDEWLDNDNNTDLMKVREVIYQMGLEDETIAQKIKSCSMTIEKHTKSQSKVASKTYIDTFGDYDDEFTKRLRLKTVNRMAIGTTYEKARKIIHENQVKNKEDYMELCERDIRLSKDPETMFAGQFTNWLEYLGIQRVYYELDDCKKKVSEYSEQIRTYYMDLSKACSELCKLDQRFPPNGMWVEYYNVKDLRNIISVAPTKKKITSDII